MDIVISIANCKDAVVTVSYTHLDVYKRQGEDGTQPFRCDADDVISTWHSVEGVLLEGHFQIDWIQTLSLIHI